MIAIKVVDFPSAMFFSCDINPLCMQQPYDHSCHSYGTWLQRNWHKYATAHAVSNNVLCLWLRSFMSSSRDPRNINRLFDYLTNRIKSHTWCIFLFIWKLIYYNTCKSHKTRVNPKNTDSINKIVIHSLKSIK